MSVYKKISLVTSILSLLVILALAYILFTHMAAWLAILTLFLIILYGFFACMNVLANRDDKAQEEKL